MADDQIRLFSQFGIQQGTEEQMLQQAEKARVQEALALAGQSRPMQPGDEDLSRAGALLGAALKNKFDKPELTPQQKQSLAMKEFATTEIKKKLKDDPEWAAQVEENPQLAGIETMRQMSKWAFDAGDITLSAELSMKAGEQYMAFREQQAEIAKYHEEVADKKATRKRNEETHARDIQDATQIILPGTNGFSLENLEEQVVTGRWDPEKEAFVTSEGNEAKNFMTLEEAISLKELGLKAMEDAGVSDVSGLDFGERVRLFNSAIPASERTGIRLAFDAMDTQSAIMNRVADIFVDFMDKGIDPSTMLDGAGRLTAFSTDLADTIKSVGKTFNVAIARGSTDDLMAGNGEIVATGINSKAFKESYADEISQIQIPADIADIGDKAAEYQSAIIQLAYAVARSNEPGARQLSDTDFRNALKELGAAAADPERLRQVIFNNFKRKADSTARVVDRVGEIATTVGLEDEWGKSNVLGTTVRKDSVLRFDDTLSRFSALEEPLTELRTNSAINEVTISPEARGDDVPLPPAETTQPAAIDYFLSE
ncbi:MAG: hypothetical protein ACYSW8_31275 [Planctomycetota bacterium]|jgi:hypothetical protein